MNAAALLLDEAESVLAQREAAYFYYVTNADELAATASICGSMDIEARFSRGRWSACA